MGECHAFEDHEWDLLLFEGGGHAPEQSLSLQLANDTGPARGAECLTNRRRNLL
jgi:hypothetical protein